MDDYERPPFHEDVMLVASVVFLVCGLVSLVLTFL